MIEVNQPGDFVGCLTSQAPLGEVQLSNAFGGVLRGLAPVHEGEPGRPGMAGCGPEGGSLHTWAGDCGR